MGTHGQCKLTSYVPQWMGRYCPEPLDNQQLIEPIGVPPDGFAASTGRAANRGNLNGRTAIDAGLPQLSARSERAVPAVIEPPRPGRPHPPAGWRIYPCRGPAARGRGVQSA